MATIVIDASALNPDGFMIFTADAQGIRGPDGEGAQHGAGRPHYDLRPGTYHFGYSNVWHGFAFHVTTDGKVDYDRSFDGFLGGRGTTTLTVRGYRVVIDTTALDVRMLGRWGWFPNAAWLEPGHRTELVLAPQADYTLQLTAGMVNFTFSLGTDGTVSFDPRYAGFASWDCAGRTLTISGYRVAIDARRLSSFALLLQATEFGLFSRTEVQQVTLVPSDSYFLQANSGSYADWPVALQLDGTWGFAPDCDPFLAGRNEKTLTLWGHPVVIDGRRAGCTSVSLSPDSGGGNSDPVAARLLAVLLPLSYNVLFEGKVTGGATFTVSRDGSVVLDANAAAHLGRGSVPSVVVKGAA